MLGKKIEKDKIEIIFLIEKIYSCMTGSGAQQGMEE